MKLIQKIDIAQLRHQFNGDMRKVVHFFVTELIPNQNAAYFIFSSALRFSSEQDVREILNAIKDKHSFAEIARQGEQALQDFQRWGCQIARYREPDQLQKLAERYLNKGHVLLEEEMAYGELCYKDAEIALKRFVTEHDAKKDPEHGIHAIIKYLMQRHYEVSIERGGDVETSNDMKTERKDHVVCSTPLQNYSWVEGLVNALYILAKSGTIIDLKADPNFEIYNITYQGKVLTSFIYDRFCPKVDLSDPQNFEPKSWLHGQVNLTKGWWDHLEILHNKVMNLSVDKNNLESLKIFYDTVTEMVWLIGNITPAHRGTGKLVEQWFTMAHLKHALRTPILNLEHPQLDVLNLTIPLSIYKQAFFSFFELESLPKPIAKMMSPPVEQKTPLTKAIVQSGGSPVIPSSNEKSKSSSLPQTDTGSKLRKT